MNVCLTRELEDFVEQAVRTGRYQSANEVIRAGLRLLKEERTPGSRFTVSSADELEEKLLVGIRQLDRGEGIPGQTAMRQLRQRAEARRRKPNA